MYGKLAVLEKFGMCDSIRKMIVEMAGRWKNVLRVSTLAAGIGIVAGVGDARGQTQDPEIDALKKLEIVFESQAEDLGISLYQSALNGTSKRKLTDGAFDRHARPFGPNQIIYESSPTAEPNLDSGIKLVNTLTGQISRTSFTGSIFDSCASPDLKGGIVLTRTMLEQTGRSLAVGPSGRDIYRASADGAKIERLTGDNIGSNEDCPVVSPDGEKIAFQENFPGQPGRRVKVAIYKIRDLPQKFNPDEAPLEALYGDIQSWSPDSKYLLIQAPTGIQKAQDVGLYLVEGATGLTRKIAAGTGGGDFTPDGNWIFYSAANLSNPRKYSLNLASITGEKRSLISEMDFSVWNPRILLSKENKVSQEGRAVFLLHGILHEIKNNKETSGMDEELTRRLNELGTRVGLLGYGGGQFVGGEWVAADQDCRLTQTHPEVRARSIAQDIEDYQKAKPGEKMTIVTHSEGGVVAMFLLKLVKDGETKIDPRGLRIVATDGANQGANKLFFDHLGAWLSLFGQTSCGILNFPNPDFLNTPSGQNLLEMWDRRLETQARLSATAVWFRAAGGELVTLGNREDCVLWAEGCGLPDLLFEILFRNLTYLLYPISTQEIPGAVNNWNTLGKSGLGHKRYFEDENVGLPALIAEIR